MINEAIERKCNLIISHHPLLFTGLKRITGRTYVERIVQKAIKHDINIFSAHTNLDNMAAGVNAAIAAKLGLKDTKILSPKTNTLSKLYTYVPESSAVEVRDALFAAGAGHVGKYSECSFNSVGKGTFRAATDTNPTIGKAGGKSNVMLCARGKNIDTDIARNDQGMTTLVKLVNDTPYKIIFDQIGRAHV